MTPDERNTHLWATLQKRGWQIRPVTFPVGTARANWTNRTIEMKPSAFHNQTARIRRYVLPHEMWHAAHYEATLFRCDELRQSRRLSLSAALEVVADAAVLFYDNSSLMRTWVIGSVAWHGKIGMRYSMRDVVSPEALAMVERLWESVR